MDHKKLFPAIIDGWYLGQETGNAIADILFGKENPGGKLPITIPRNVGQVPIYYNKLRSGRPGRYFRSTTGPLWPFGHGLSYTSFEYSNLEITATSPSSAMVKFDITNTGSRAGDEVVQLYISDEYCSVVRPPLELKRFKRLSLESGQTKTVMFILTKDAFAFYEPEKDDWVVEPGTFKIMVGSSSQDIRLSKKIVL